MKLQRGAAEAVFNNQTINPLFKDPVFQVIKFEKAGREGNEKPRVKANLSDGVQHIKGIFTSNYTTHFNTAKSK